MKETAKIIDVACGGKMFWFDKDNPDVVFCDKREEEHNLCDGRFFEVKPDVLTDFTDLPFETGRFKLLVFDPPHLLRNTGKSKFATIYGSLNDAPQKLTGYQHIKYGQLYNDWRDMIGKGFKECFRVLAADGVLIFKWNETDIKTSEVLKLAPYPPLFGHKSGKQSKTHWICFMKMEKELI